MTAFKINLFRGLGSIFKRFPARLELVSCWTVLLILSAVSLQEEILLRKPKYFKAFHDPVSDLFSK